MYTLKTLLNKTKQKRNDNIMKQYWLIRFCDIVAPSDIFILLNGYSIRVVMVENISDLYLTYELLYLNI